MKLEFDVTVFLEDERTGLFERHMEEHAQKAYSVKMIEAWLVEASFEILEIYGTQKTLDESDRVFYIARWKTTEMEE
jgi:hypothetical protein